MGPKHLFPIHRKLSDEHIFPNNAQKMRNKLTFDVLDKDMLHLMQTNGSEDMKAAISLLENTIVLVEILRTTGRLRTCLCTLQTINGCLLLV